MNILHVPLLVLSLMMADPLFAATAQQQKVQTCHADATVQALDGDKHTFMSDCLQKK
ncbi:PsiF family protein [Pseudomonas sp. R5(2019)]|uniref:PsiF family protein n=1 Tax=Pseudomonas sp. R5(2019) TaxID=2697566 RepID=UPI001413226C|nr:PsiF family protein [Pseudomonas sp. R5(2019)]NBA95142.1 hypothetical protein [Pseudomonas sp. R5(2019)]